MKTSGGHKFMSICSTNSSVGRHKLDNLMSFMLHELVGISFALCFVSTLIHFVFVQLLHQSIPNTFPCKLVPRWRRARNVYHQYEYELYM